MKRHNRLAKRFAMACCVFALISQSSTIAADSAAQAYKLYQDKRYREAAQMFETCLNVPIPDANVCYYAAVCYQQAGNLGRAKSLYKQVLQLSPKSTIGQYADSILRKLDPSAQMSSASGSYSPSQYQQTSPSPQEAVVSGPDEGSVYYKDIRKQIWVPVEINNRSMEMELDTGAPTVFVGRNQLDKIGLRPPEGRASGQSGGSSNDVLQDYWIMPVNLRVGPFTVSNLKMKVISTNYASPLLGQSFLQYFDYTVDQSAKCIRLKRKSAGGSAVAKSGQFIPFIYQEGGNRIIVNVEINGRSVPMILDTGNTASTVVFTSLAQAKQCGCPPPADAVNTRHGGVSGSGRVLEYYTNRVKLGPIDRSNVKVGTNLETTNDTEPPLLGHDFFDGWQYNVDLKESKIWLLRR